jgi:hypothetical protein
VHPTTLFAVHRRRPVHRAGDEQAWWNAAGIDPVKVARQFWQQTRLNDPHDRHYVDLVARPKTRLRASTSDGTRESGSNQLVTDLLLNVATDARLFHASDGTGFADLLIEGPPRNLATSQQTRQR